MLVEMCCVGELWKTLVLGGGMTIVVVVMMVCDLIELCQNWVDLMLCLVVCVGIVVEIFRCVDDCCLCL